MENRYYKLPVAANAVEAIAGNVKAVSTMLNKASLLLVPAPHGSSPRQKLQQFDRNNQTPQWIIYIFFKRIELKKPWKVQADLQQLFLFFLFVVAVAAESMLTLVSASAAAQSSWRSRDVSVNLGFKNVNTWLVGRERWEIGIERTPRQRVQWRNTGHSF